MDQLYIDNLAKFENVILNDFDFSHSSPRALANMAYEFGWNDREAANKNIVASGSTSNNKSSFQFPHLEDVKTEVHGRLNKKHLPWCGSAVVAIQETYSILAGNKKR